MDAVTHAAGSATSKKFSCKIGRNQDSVNAGAVDTKDTSMRGSAMDHGHTLTLWNQHMLAGAINTC